MKLVVCILMIVVNISNNGKASLESFTPTTSGILFEDTTKNSDKSCYRPCKFNVKPRRCYYDFVVEPTILENGRPAISINGRTPGPPINVCVNDVIVVEVKNKVPDQDVAIHWHGLEQKGTPHMDGVPMVTQCPIAYGATYKYAFIASTPGTFFYHSDSVSHQGDGVYGSLVVNQPQPLEPHAALYDYDRSNENTLLIAATYPRLLTGNLEDTARQQPVALTINGNEEHFKIITMQSFAYRLRLINAIATECPVVVKIQRHEMVVIASDGKPVMPAVAKKVQLYPGERMDVIVRASQPTGGYWVEARAAGACAGLTAGAMLIYSGFNYTSMLHHGQNEISNEDELDLGVPISGQMLESLLAAPESPDVKSVYLGIDRNLVDFKEKDVDFRYISDAIPKKPFYPASLFLDTGVVQINGKSFLYPNSPMLLFPRDVKADFTCKVGEEKKNQEPQCVLVMQPEGDVMELAMVNEGAGSNDSYTFHMHGYSVQIVATWQNPEGKPLSKDEFLRLDEEGKVLRNTKNPPLKDTFIVPNKGYTIVRFRPDQPGSWLLECRSCALSSLPTAVLINIPQKMPKSILRSLSKCGSYRPPDVLLN